MADNRKRKVDRGTIVHALLIASFTAPSCFAQCKVNDVCVFDVASFKPAPPPRQWQLPGKVSFEPSRVVMASGTLLRLLAAAYDMPESRLTGPGWLATERYDVEGKVIGRQSDRSELRLMLRALLLDRCKLSVRSEERRRDYSALVRDGHAEKLTKLADNDVTPTSSRDDLFRRQMTMTQFADLLTGLLAMPIYGPDKMPGLVVDETGLEGIYDVTLGSWSPIGNNPESAMWGLHSALQRLGLKLVARTGSVPYLIVDHVERPAPN